MAQQVCVYDYNLCIFMNVCVSMYVYIWMEKECLFKREESENGNCEEIELN